MGDRVVVRVTVLATQKAAALEILDTPEQENIESSATVSFEYGEVNYGELAPLKDLAEAGIAYDSHWDSGNEFNEGTEYLRFTPDGDAVVITCYVDDENPDLYALLELIDDPVKLRQYVVNHAAKVIIDDLEESQVEYGKLYQAKQLITPCAP